MPEPTRVHAVDDKLRVLDLQVKTASGDLLGLQVPWDRSAFDLEPVLVAGTGHDHPERSLVAFPSGAESVDLLEVPLGRALRHAENPDGAEALVIQVESQQGLLEFVVACRDVAEPEPHTAYPRPRDELAERQVGAYLATEDSDWFCDGSSQMECCETTREAPHELQWVAF